VQPDVLPAAEVAVEVVQPQQLLFELLGCVMHFRLPGQNH
jgi:hypothetical protein